MKKQTKIIIGVFLFAIIIMAIGYANLNSTTLTITGSASSKAEQTSFKVYFTGESTLKNPNNDTVQVTAGPETTSATVNFTGLKEKGDKAFAILEIKNGSNGIDASSVDVETAAQTDTTFFDIEATMCTSTGGELSNLAVISGGTTYVKVSAELLQTPTSNVETGITVSIKATPKANT